jgi:hypothetical protein
MRVYLAIALAALTLLAIMGLSARFWVGDYLSSESFRQTAFVEIGSFILTSAVVGGLSAAVADYLRRRELLPLRRRGFRQIDIAILGILDNIGKIADQAPDSAHLAFFYDPVTPIGVVITEGYRLEPPRRAHRGVVTNSWHNITLSIGKLQRNIDRFALSFDIDSQEDLAAIEQFFDNFRRRMNIVDFHMGTQPGGFRTSNGDEDDYQEDYQVLQQALARLAAETGLPSRAAEKIADNLQFFANDARYVVGAIAAMDPDNQSVAGAARICKTWWDFSWTSEDMAAHVQARVPKELLGVKYDTALSIVEVSQRFGNDTLKEWRTMYPFKRDPNLRIVE